MSVPTEMKVFGSSKYGASGEVLEEVTVPVPAATGRDLLVKVSAVATNPIDYKRILNFGNTAAPVEKAPFVAGWDCAGVVAAVGEGVTGFKVGDEVMFAGAFERDGCFGEFALVNERIAARKPATVSMQDAAAIPLVFLTAYEGLVESIGVSVPASDAERAANKAKSILITAGAGGVGSTAIQLASRVLGLTVIATASRPETVEWCKKLGADHVISHREAFAPQLEALGVKQIDYAFLLHDFHTHLKEVTPVIKPLGHVCGINVPEQMDTVEWFPLFMKRVSFSLGFMYTRHMFDAEPEKQGEALAFAAKLYDAKTLESTVTVRSKLSLDGLKGALAAQESGKTIGKIALEW